MRITPEQFEAWKEDPITKAILAEVNRLKADLRDMLSDGAFLSDDPHKTQMEVALAVGHIRGLDQIGNSYFKDAANQDEDVEQGGEDGEQD